MFAWLGTHSACYEFAYGHHGFGGYDLVYHQYYSVVAPYAPGDEMLYISVLSGDQSTEPCIQLSTG